MGCVDIEQMRDAAAMLKKYEKRMREDIDTMSGAAVKLGNEYDDEGMLYAARRMAQLDEKRKSLLRAVRTLNKIIAVYEETERKNMLAMEVPAEYRRMAVASLVDLKNIGENMKDIEIGG